MLNRELQDQVFSKKYLFISNDKNVMKADYKYCMSCIYDLHIYMIIKILYLKKIYNLSKVDRSCILKSYSSSVLQRFVPSVYFLSKVEKSNSNVIFVNF